jgi:hypothetical protein
MVQELSGGVRLMVADNVKAAVTADLTVHHRVMPTDPACDLATRQPAGHTPRDLLPISHTQLHTTHNQHLHEVNGLYRGDAPTHLRRLTCPGSWKSGDEQIEVVSASACIVPSLRSGNIRVD